MNDNLCIFLIVTTLAIFSSKGCDQYHDREMEKIKLNCPGPIPSDLPPIPMLPRGGA